MRSYIGVVLIALAIPIAIFSCTESENEGGSPIGVWKISSVTTTECADPGDNETFTCTSNCETTVITENSIQSGSDPSEPLTISGNTFTVDGQSGTFVVAGSTLTLTYKIPGDCKLIIAYTKV